jgi:hypothetical protein
MTIKEEKTMPREDRKPAGMGGKRPAAAKASAAKKTVAKKTAAKKTSASRVTKKR